MRHLFRRGLHYTMMKKRGNISDYPTDIGPEYVKKPILVVTFDDGRLSDYTTAFPEMQSRGIKGTSYIIGYRADINLTDFMSWAQITEMYNAGWDMQCHTYEHTNADELTTIEWENQLIMNNTAFTNAGLPEPNHLAYPRGIFTAGSRDISKQYRKTQRGTNYNYTDSNDMDSFQFDLIKSIHGDMTDQAKLDKAKQAIDYAIDNNLIMTTYLHKIVDTETTAGSTTELPLFINFLDYIVSSGIETMTMTEMVDYVVGYRLERGLSVPDNVLDYEVSGAGGE